MELQNDHELVAAEPEERGSSDHPHTDGVDIAEDTDGRELWKPLSRWPPESRVQQRYEGIYLFLLIFLSVGLLLFFTIEPEAMRITSFTLLAILAELRIPLLLLGSGLLGGTIYGAKWLYHAVAKGLWHEDRRLWRFLSPWISMGTAFGVGAVIFAGFIPFRSGPDSTTNSGSAAIAIGFLAGYFADKALAKMKDVTEVLFGETQTHPGSRESKGDQSGLNN